MDLIPADLRAKYEEMHNTIDPISKTTVFEVLGRPGSLSTSPSGARCFDFDGGHIASFDQTQRYPIVCVYGPIFEFYNRLGGPTKSPLGRPLTDVRDVADGSRCAVFEGGHIHQWGEKAEPFSASNCRAKYQPPAPPFHFDMGPNKMPVLFLRKWIELSLQRDPISTRSIAEELGCLDSEVIQIEAGGQRIRFQNGQVVMFDSGIYVVYGSIYNVWVNYGEWDGVCEGWGRPLTDEQDTGDGGRCSVFEGGHIHRYGNDARPFPADQCTAKLKPTPMVGVSWNGMPPDFQRKWSQLALITHPLTGKPIVFALGRLTTSYRRWARGREGYVAVFTDGCLGTTSNDPGAPPSGTPLELIQPFANYGPINSFWGDEGASFSSYGIPVCDEQSLPDGGRCSIFEHGHIHLHNGVAKGFPENECTAPYQPLRDASSGPAPSLSLPIPVYSKPTQTSYPTSAALSQPSSLPSQNFSQPSQPLSQPSPNYQQPQSLSDGAYGGGNAKPAHQYSTNAGMAAKHPVGFFASVIFYLFGVNIERDREDDNCCCCCCCCSC